MIYKMLLVTFNKKMNIFI